MSIKIPQDGRFSLPNNSDRFGNVHYVKNMNFDEEGYLKLSPRAVSFINEADNADFNLPLAFGRASGSEFLVATAGKPFETSLSENASGGLSGAIDNGTSVPTESFDSHGIWWQNRWHVIGVQGGADDELYYRTPSTGNWTDAGLSGSITYQKLHPMEVFRSRAQLCIGNGNGVLQVDTSYVETTSLVIPADYEVNGLAYNNNIMAVATRLSDTAAGQNQEAYLFIWDGSTTSANQAFGVGSDVIVAVKGYKSSFVILTRAGQLKYFNGAGFEDLASLPFYYQNITWGDSQNPEAYGDILKVDGDIIYININANYEDFGIKGERNIPQSPGGVYCYDPKVGLYHRYSPSISEVSRLTVTSGNIDTATNILTTTAGTIPATGNPVKYIHSRTSKIGGLQTGTVYYVIKLSSSTLKLATTRQNALDGTAIDITSTGAATNYFMALDLVDYGASYINRTGAVALPEIPNHVVDGLLFGVELFRSTSGANDAHFNFVTLGFKNIGYAVTPKIFSQGLTDNTKKIFIRHRPLKTGDKITIKRKTKEIAGIPTTTPQDGISCTWSSDRELYTTCNLSEVESFINDNNGECELEIISGAGAGQMSQIESIAYDSGTYSIVLKDIIEGAASGRVGDILIENWALLDTVTPENDKGIKEIPLDGSSKWSKFKIITEGVDVTIEDIQLPNETHKPIA